MRNLPSYGRWQKQFSKRGVEIIGVHTPETDSERLADNVIRKLRERRLAWPVLLDPEGENWRRWGQAYWPTVYLIDREGFIRYRWEGELEWNRSGGEAAMAAKIEELLKE